MIRTILAPIEADGRGGSILAYATTLAFQHNAHVEVLHCRPRRSASVLTGTPVPRFLKQRVEEGAAGVADAEERAMRAQYEHFARVLNLQVVQDDVESGPSTSWHEITGSLPEVIKERGLLADLIVVAKPNRDQTLGVTTVHAALFNTGTPVLMCPAVSKRPDSLGETIAVAWNGSIQAARAMALTVPLMKRAKALTILTAGREEPHGAKAEDLKRYLARRGIDAEVERISPGGKVAAALMERCDAIGADLMIMGAYSESHEREAIFGGNSQRIVDKADIPVVMVH